METASLCAWQESNLPANQMLSRPEDSTEDSTAAPPLASQSAKASALESPRSATSPACSPPSAASKTYNRSNSSARSPNSSAASSAKSVADRAPRPDRTAPRTRTISLDRRPDTDASSMQSASEFVYVYAHSRGSAATGEVTQRCRRPRQLKTSPAVAAHPVGLSTTRSDLINDLFP